MNYEVGMRNAELSVGGRTQFALTLYRSYAMGNAAGNPSVSRLPRVAARPLRGVTPARRSPCNAIPEWDS